MTPPSAQSDVSDLLIAEGRLASATRQDVPKQTIAIAATFTAEPVEEALAYWFQQLLDPTSLLATNQRGVNVLLLRFEDWMRFEADAEHGSLAEQQLECSVQ